MRTNITLRVIINTVILIVTSLISVSCSSSSSSQTFGQILSVIPDTENNRAWVAINDYAQMRKQFQIDVPRIDASVEEQKQYIFELFNYANAEEYYQIAANIGFIDTSRFLEYNLEAMHNLGIGYWSIDQEVEVGKPPTKLTMLRGQFDIDKIQHALDLSAKDDPPSIETYSQNTIFGWGGDWEVNLAKRLTPPAYDSIGRGGRFVFQNSYAFRTVETPTMKLILDTQKGEHASLFDVSEYKLMAKELSSQGIMTALLSNQTQSVDYIRSKLIASQQYKAEDVDKYLAGPKLLPYQAIVLGMAKDESGIYLLIILIHADDKAAAKNVDLLQQRIDQTSSIRFNMSWKSIVSSSSITSRGRVLAAKLYGPIPAFGSNWNSWYQASDPLVLHE